jgi:hypothetical protein
MEGRELGGGFPQWDILPRAPRPGDTAPRHDYDYDGALKKCRKCTGPM